MSQDLSLFREQPLFLKERMLDVHLGFISHPISFHKASSSTDVYFGLLNGTSEQSY